MLFRSLTGRQEVAHDKPPHQRGDGMDRCRTRCRQFAGRVPILERAGTVFGTNFAVTRWLLIGENGSAPFWGMRGVRRPDEGRARGGFLRVETDCNRTRVVWEGPRSEGANASRTEMWKGQAGDSPVVGYAQFSVRSVESSVVRVGSGRDGVTGDLVRGCGLGPRERVLVRVLARDDEVVHRVLDVEVALALDRRVAVAGLGVL